MKNAFSTLSEVEDFIWKNLQEAVRRGRHGWHCGVLATSPPEGPEARVVVLRAAERDSRTLRFHTDARSPKHSQLLDFPKVAWTFYDPDPGVQLRVSGTARPLSALATEALWNTLPRRCLKSYATIHPPGSPQETGSADLGPGWESVEPGAIDAAATLPHFSAFEVAIEKMDFLFLRAAGHQRALFAGLHSNSPTQSWLVP